MLFASAVEHGPSVETVVSDDAGLGRLEALRLDSFFLGLSHIPYPIFDPTFFHHFLVLCIDYLEPRRLEGRGGVFTLGGSPRV